jgi:hypothetical protein
VRFGMDSGSPAHAYSSFNAYKIRIYGRLRINRAKPPWLEIQRRSG